MNSRTEDEQIEAIKLFLQEHGSKILLVILVLITSYFGYQSWQGNKQAASESASVYYSELSMLVASGDRLDDSDRERFDSIFARLADEYPRSLYAGYGALYKARVEMAGNKPAQAAQTLQWVIDNNANRDIKALARLRLARVEMARGEYSQALNLLQADPRAFGALYEQARGDIYLAQGEDDKALQAYKKARSMQADTMSMSGRLLDIKIESLESGDQGKLYTVGQAGKSLPEDEQAP